MEFVEMGCNEKATITADADIIEGTLVEGSFQWQTSCPAFLTLTPDGDGGSCECVPADDIPGGGIIEATVSCRYQLLDGDDRPYTVKKDYHLTIIQVGGLMDISEDVVVASKT